MAPAGGCLAHRSVKVLPAHRRRQQLAELARRRRNRRGRTACPRLRTSGSHVSNQASIVENALLGLKGRAVSRNRLSKRRADYSRLLRRLLNRAEDRPHRCLAVAAPLRRRARPPREEHCIHLVLGRQLRLHLPQPD